MNLIKSSVRLVGMISLGIIFFGGGLFLLHKLYIEPIFSTPPKLFADPSYIMAALFGCSIIFITFIFLFIIVYLRECIHSRKVIENYSNQKFTSYYFLFTLTLGGTLGLTSNAIILHKIIPDNGYVLCPKKIGYKKNLLRDYVLDVNQCEKF